MTGDYRHPVLYRGNIALKEGMYYVQDGVRYQCIKDTKDAVWAHLSALQGIYVKAVDRDGRKAD